MTRQLVFLHGRSQQGKNSINLKKEWIDAWQVGLDKSGLKMPIEESQIHFPFYGDTLDQLTNGISEEEAANIIIRGKNIYKEDESISKEEEAFIKQYLKQVQHASGISNAQIDSELPIKEKGVLNWPWVQAFLSLLDKNVPGASGISVAIFTRDVYSYLTDTNIRQKMDTGVQSALNFGSESIMVSHSLGTVIAYNVLRQAGLETNVPLFITLGSPLAVNIVKKRIAPIAHPKCAKHWFNAMDQRDVVALFPLDTDNFDVDPIIENKTDVDNPTANRHGISGYLGDRDVAYRIYEALTAP